MLSWSSKAGARLLSAAAVAILLVFWSFTYLDLPFDTGTLTRPWSSPNPVSEDHDQEHPEYSYVDDNPSQPPVAVEDPFFKLYSSTEASSSEAADQTATLAQASFGTAVPTDATVVAPFISPSPAAPTTPPPGLQSPAIASAVPSTRRAETETSTASAFARPYLNTSSPNHDDDESATTTTENEPYAHPLILYAYYETPDTRPNLEFFVRHALHAHATFIFILNGATDAAETLLPTHRPNVHVVKRPNTCFDLGAYGEVLLANSSSLVYHHTHFILINASIRGPFVPFWSRACWSDAYLAKITPSVKLVGMTMNCRPDLPRHVQSMILATDAIGLATLLTPAGLDNCPQSMNEAVAFETGLTALVKANGYTVGVMMAMGHSYAGWADACANGDVTVPGAYDGTNIHPYETLFVKTKRGADPRTLELLTKWHDGSNYSSYDYC